MGHRLEPRSVHGDRGEQGRTRGTGAGPEPDPWLVGPLERTRRLPLPQEVPIELAAVAISSEWEPVPLNVDRRGRASNWIGDGPGCSQSGGGREIRSVHTRSLHDLLRGRFAPDLVKIDIEDAEHDARRGDGVLLEEVRPIMVIEVLERTREGVSTILRDHGYSLHDSEDQDFPGIPVCSFNTLARPE